MTVVVPNQPQGIPPEAGGVPEAYTQSTVDKELKSLITQLKQGAGTTEDLGALAAELSASGTLTESQKMLLEASAHFLLSSIPEDPGNPVLDGPQKQLIQNFLTKLESMPKREIPGSSTPASLLPAGENAWLNTDAVVSFGVLMMNIISILGQVRFKEAQKEVQLAKTYISIAKNIQDTIVQQGEVEAEKRMLMARQYAIEGNLAIASVVLSAATQLVRSAKIASAEKTMLAERGQKTLSMDDRMSIEKNVTADMEFLSTAFKSIPDAIGSLQKATIEGLTAELERSGARTRALEEYLKSVSSLVKDVMSSLSGGDQELAQQIKQLLDLWVSFLQARTQMWSAS